MDARSTNWANPGARPYFFKGPIRLHVVMLKKTTLFSSSCLPAYTCIHPLFETLRFSAFQWNCNRIALLGNSSGPCLLSVSWCHSQTLQLEINWDSFTFKCSIYRRFVTSQMYSNHDSSFKGTVCEYGLCVFLCGLSISLSYYLYIALKPAL